MPAKLHISTLRAYQPKRLARSDLQPSAVLIPVMRHEHGDRIILTVRHDRLRFQPGHICFPGGKAEPGESDLSRCALREAQEEISLPPTSVEIIAQMDQVTVASRYLVTPFVGLVEPDASVTPQGAEVARVLVVNAADLLLRDALHTITHTESDASRLTYAFTAGEVTIWGATARMLKHFLDIGYGAADMTAQSATTSPTAGCSR